MAINTTEGAATSEAPRSTTEQAFSGATLRSDGGTSDVMGLISMIGGGRIDASIQPYVEKVLELTKASLPTVTMKPLSRSEKAFVYLYKGQDGKLHIVAIQFINGADQVHPEYIPASFKLMTVQEEISAIYGNDAVIDDMRIIRSDYQPDMDRAENMAALIIRTFSTRSNPEIRNASIANLVSSEFNVSFNLNEARAFEREMSPHGVPPRMEFAMTLSVKVENSNGPKLIKDLNSAYRPIAVIGGFVDIRGRDRVFSRNLNRDIMAWKPVFNITVCNSSIPLVGMVAVMLSAFCPTIYQTNMWAQQWLNTLDDKRPQPGLLERERDNPSEPVIIRNREEMDDFILNFMDRPNIALHLMDGADIIPGTQLFANESPEARAQLLETLARFYQVDPAQFNVPAFGKTIEHRFEGTVGRPNGTLEDSREFDYLYFAATNGLGAMDQHTMRLMMGLCQPSERAKLLASLTGHSFRSTNMDTVFGLNADFVGVLSNMARAHNLQIRDPQASNEFRPIGAMFDGFGNGANVAPVISSGSSFRGFGLGSIWNQ